MANPEHFEVVCDRIFAGPKPQTTMRVWMKIITRLGWNDVEVPRSVELARVSGVDEGEVRRALSQLTRYGALVRKGRGQYEVNPNVAYKGSLEERAAKVPELRVV